MLSEEKVNIIVHGHEPTLSEMLAVAAMDDELLAYAKEKGATGINIAGICCTANEVLMRHGLPIAGNFLQQELAIITGAVEMMIVDVQCVMPSLPEVMKCFHTRLVSTSEIAQTFNAEQITFEVEHGYEHAVQSDPHGHRQLRQPRQGARAHPERVDGPGGGLLQRDDLPHAGRSLPQHFPPAERRHHRRAHPRRGRHRRLQQPQSRAPTTPTCASTRELIKNNVLVLQTGCAAIACAKAGLLVPEAALEQAGDTLREVCEAVGIPPVLHMGSCVDNSRILLAATNVLLEGGLGEDLSDLPVAGAAPEWMSEKAVAIGHYFVASGLYVVLGPSALRGRQRECHEAAL